MTSREQFEAWFRKRWPEFDHPTDSAFEVWQAARAQATQNTRSSCLTKPSLNPGTTWSDPMSHRYEHCSVDLETLGTRPGSVIFSIGAVFFDPFTNEPGPAFYQVIDVASSCVAGLRGDHDTIAWWEKQSGEAKVAYDEAFGGQGEPLPKTLEAFATWLVSQSRLPDGADSVCVWGNGAAFDNALLAEAYRACGLAVPWKFWHDRCFRTLKALGKDLGVKEPRFGGVPHHALDDACHQANWACLIFQALAPAPVPEGDQGPVVVRESHELRGKPIDPAILGAKSQELMPDPPTGYLREFPTYAGEQVKTGEDLSQRQLKQWPMCVVHGTALVPTTTGFVCERCGGRS